MIGQCGSDELSASLAEFLFGRTLLQQIMIGLEQSAPGVPDSLRLKDEVLRLVAEQVFRSAQPAGLFTPLMSREQRPINGPVPVGPRANVLMGLLGYVAGDYEALPGEFARRVTTKGLNATAARAVSDFLRAFAGTEGERVRAAAVASGVAAIRKAAGRVHAPRKSDVELPDEALVTFAARVFLDLALRRFFVDRGTPNWSHDWETEKRIDALAAEIVAGRIWFHVEETAGPRCKVPDGRAYDPEEDYDSDVAGGSQAAKRKMRKGWGEIRDAILSDDAEARECLDAIRKAQTRSYHSLDDELAFVKLARPSARPLGVHWHGDDSWGGRNLKPAVVYDDGTAVVSGPLNPEEALDLMSPWKGDDGFLIRRLGRGLYPREDRDGLGERLVLRMLWLEVIPAGGLAEMAKACSAAIDKEQRERCLAASRECQRVLDEALDEVHRRYEPHAARKRSGSAKRGG